MKKGKTLPARLFGLILLAMGVVILAPGGVKAADAPWMTDHDIPAYQKKNMYETETVAISDVSVEDQKGDPIQESVHFAIFNSTKQEVQEEVDSKDGTLPTLNLIKDHNYIIFAQDENYKMDNVYVWVNPEGKIVNIKDIENTNPPAYPYGEVTNLKLEKRDTPSADPKEDRRVRTYLYTKVNAGGGVANLKVVFTSDIETVTATSKEDGRGTLVVDLLEDVNYMVSVESNNWDIEPFPLAVKDKSEYGADKYPYDHTSCHRVGGTEVENWDTLWLVDKGETHKADTVLTNTNYGDYPVYKDIAGNTTITGLDFKDCLVLDKELDKSLVTGLNGDYDVIDIKVVNPHRWEFCKFASGDYTITEKVDENKQVKQVYYLKDGQLEKVDFEQKGSEVTFQMNSLSLYPMVVEYGGEMEPEPEFDPQKMTVKVVDEKGAPVSGVKLFLENDLFEENRLDFEEATDAEGKAVYDCSKVDSSAVMPGDEYILQPEASDDYTCENPVIVTFAEEDSIYIDTVNDQEYTGQEVTLTVKSTAEPEPEFDPQKMTVKVVDEKGAPVSGVKLFLEIEDYGEDSRLDFAEATDAEGKAVYDCTQEDNIIMDGDPYVLQPEASDDYTCENPVIVTFAEEDSIYIDTVNGQEYTGQEVTLTLKSTAEPEPEPEPEPVIAEVRVNISAVSMDGGEATITVLGADLPETLYYSISYVADEQPVAVVEGQEVGARGQATLKRFAVTLPSTESYPDATAWKISVAPTKAGTYTDAGEIKVDKTILTEATKKALGDAITEGKNLDSSKYTEETWNEFAAVVKEAILLTKKVDATEEEYQTALSKIAEKKKALVLKDSEEGEFNPQKMTVKVVDEKGTPVSGVKLFMEIDGMKQSRLDFAGATDAEGKAVYDCAQEDNLIMDGDSYVLQPEASDDYTCEKYVEVVFALDEKDDIYIETINNTLYMGQEVTLTVKSTAEQEPEPTIDRVDVKPSVVSMDGGEATITVAGANLPETLYYSIFYVADGKTVAVVEGQEVETRGQVSLKRFTVTLPSTESYPDATAWKISVAATEAGTYKEATEIKVDKTIPTEATKKALGDAIAEGKSLDSSQYTEETWNEFAAVIKDAIRVTGNPNATEEDYQTALSKIAEKKKALKKKTAITDADTAVSAVSMDGGKIKITVAGTELPETLYYNLSYVTEKARAVQMVVEGQKVTAQGTAQERTFEVTLPSTEDYPDATAWRIGVALTKAGTYTDAGEIKVDRTILTEVTKQALNNAISEKEKLDEKKYTKESWTEYINAVNAAIALTSKDDATEGEYQDALDKIVEKREALALKENPTDSSGGGETNNSGQGGSGTDGASDPGQGDQNPAGSKQDGTQTKGAVKTGDTAPILPIAGIMFLSFAVIVGIRVRTKTR